MTRLAQRIFGVVVKSSPIKFISLAAILGMVVLLSGCPPSPVTTLEPLYSDDEGERVEDPGLEGKWVSYDSGGSIYLDLTRNKGAKSHTEFNFELGLDTTMTFRAVLLRLGNHELLDLVPISHEIIDYEPFVMVTHWILRVKRNGDELRLAELDPGWVRQFVPTDKVIERGDDLTLTAPTKELQKLFDEHGDDPAAFKSEFHFKRQFTLAAAESYSAVAMGELTDAYMNVGEYEKALIAARRYLELRPNNPMGHYRIAQALLANYDAEQSRSELRQWFRLCSQPNLDKDWENNEDDRCPGENDLHRYLGHAYFAEGRYTEATQEFDKYLSSSRDYEISAGALFENVVALRSLHRSSEAQKVAKRFQFASPMSRFPATEHFLSGELSEADLMKQATDEWAKCQAPFYIASLDLASGNKTKAREMFQRAVDTCNYTWNEHLAARFRLKQITAK